MAKILNEVNTMKSSIIKKCFKRIPTLQTERLILRKLSVSDYNDMYEYTHIESVTDYVTWYPHPDRDYTKQYLQIVQEQYRNGEFFDWAVILRSENKMIGTCGFTSFDTQHNCGEIGYVINPAYAYHSYATEAAKEVIRFGFLNLNLHRIYARYMDGNTASRRVMDKCGMIYEGCARSSMLVKDKYRSIHTCSIISDEFIRMYTRNQ